MTSLTWLRANKTHLSDVPDSLTKLNKLEDLILSRNEIKELPQEITEMAGLRVGSVEFVFSLLCSNIRHLYV